MPKLSSPNIVELKLPSGTEDDPTIVKLDTTITTKQALDLSQDEDKTEATIGLITAGIKEWNYANEKGEIEPINAETVGRMPLEDFTVLAEKIGESVDATLSAERVSNPEKKA